jgi:hypothetical protein
VWRSLETAVRETRAVYATPSSGGMYNVRIALNQRVPGEARNAIAAVFGSLANAKHVFVVDPDIDVFSDEQVDWAFATRFQADRDLVVARGMRTLPLDPSLAVEHRRQGGFRPYPPWESDPNTDSQAADARRPALRLAAGGARRRAEILRRADGRRGSRDGREIVRELEACAARELPRDHEGRYQVTR